MPIFTKEDYEQRAINIVKYQNFSTESAMNKMPVTMPKTIFNAAVAFIRHGTITKNHLSKPLIKEIKRCIRKHVQPLTPSDIDKRIERQHRRKRRRIITEKVTLPIVNHNENTITIPQPESKMKDKINEKIKILSIQLDILKELLEQQ